MAAKKRIGRPPKAEEDRKAVNFTFRSRGQMRERLQAAAIAVGRSISEEIEFRLERSFWQEEKEEIEKLTEAVKLQVTLSERLRSLLEQAATHKGHSMNTEIVDRLDVSFQHENAEKMIEKAARDGVQAHQEFQEEMIERAAKRAARDAVQAQREETRKLLAELSKSKHESPPKGED
jgi:predicted HicB family RNase H-like nuclease